MFFRFILIILYYVLLSNHTFANFDIAIEKLYPPKCSILKDSKVLLCPRIMEIDVKIGNQKSKKLVNCIVFSEEEEVLAFGENYINPPKGKIYLTIREARRKINEMKLIATAKCKYTE
ncbi:MAG: hypothetical protein CMJ07_09900 [Pelagibacterales bacterium]|nr:hypothetical protein [Pelagibacterales bacterium]